MPAAPRRGRRDISSWFRVSSFEFRDADARGSVDVKPADAEHAGRLDVAAPVEQVAPPELVERLVAADAGGERLRADREALERAGIVERRIRHRVVDEQH